MKESFLDTMRSVGDAIKEEQNKLNTDQNRNKYWLKLLIKRGQELNKIAEFAHRCDLQVK